MKGRILLLLCLFAMATGTVAQQPPADSVRISLLTCSPGTEVYSLYGHTALRAQCPSRDLDCVFNYGVFDFRRPHFAWHFVLGECDYEVAAYPFDAFLHEYEARGSSVTEQHLLLTREEANRLLMTLIANCQPEHRTYRYNFLTNNCTTKVRDQIERAVDGTVVYEEADEHPTFRQLLHHYTAGHPWAETGNDLLLGAECDVPTSDRAAQFLPEQLMSYMAGAMVYDSLNNRHPLAAEAEVLVAAHEQQPVEEFPLSPLQVGLCILGLCLLVAVLERVLRRMLWGFDIVLMGLQGLAGLLVCLMFFFSQHPTVGSNWHLWLLNPLPLLCIPWVVRCAIGRRVCLYHYLNALALTLFLVFIPWIPQDFPLLTPFLALALFTRPVSYYLHYQKVESEK